MLKVVISVRKLCIPLSSVLIFAVALTIVTAEENVLSGTFTDWRKHPAINYADPITTDPVARLQQRLAAGQISLPKDGVSGYLTSLLKALDIPISSQVAVFVPDSAQRDRITPQNPRTIFFNDDVAIGWVRGGFIEIAAQDPRQAVVFYTIDQPPDAKPLIRRRDDCLSCHHNYSTVGVPGMVVRSAGQYNVDHSIPIEERWGGWYVTGSLGSVRHRGNLDIDSLFQSATANTTENLNWMSFDRKFDAKGYLTAQSDVVALMVFEHQMHMMNLLSRIGWEARVAEYRGKADVNDKQPILLDTASKEVVDYMLFTDEATIRSKVQGATRFAEEFESRGPRDRRGRSLRQFQLNGRLMKYPCSYMIHSALFDSLPAQAKRSIYRRMWNILSGQEKSPKYSRLSKADRLAVVEILKDTKMDLPDYFQAAAVR